MKPVSRVGGLKKKFQLFNIHREQGERKRREPRNKQVNKN